MELQRACRVIAKPAKSDVLRYNFHLEPLIVSSNFYIKSLSEEIGFHLAKTECRTFVPTIRAPRLCATTCVLQRRYVFAGLSSVSICRAPT